MKKEYFQLIKRSRNDERVPEIFDIMISLRKKREKLFKLGYCERSCLHIFINKKNNIYAAPTGYYLTEKKFNKNKQFFVKQEIIQGITIEQCDVLWNYHITN